MFADRYRTPRRARPTPKCLFCDVHTKPSIIFRLEHRAIRGWKCPRCGFTMIHPDDIPRAIHFLKRRMRLRL